MAAETEAPVAPDVTPATEVAPAVPPVKAPKPPAEKAAKGKGKGKEEKKDAKKGKKKGKKGDEEPEEEGGGPSVAAHPRAARAVSRAKGWGGLIGFVLGGYLSLPTNTLAAAGLRALIAGVVCYVVTWAGAVFLWRRLVILEIKGREQQRHAAVQAAAARRQLPAAPPDRAGARNAS
jgi:hypothetical protein